MTPREQAHLQVLKILTERPGISQREMADVLSVSLGKSNYLIKAENVRLAWAYLARKESEYEALREEITVLRRELGVPNPPPSTINQADLP